MNDQQNAQLINPEVLHLKHELQQHEQDVVYKRKIVRDLQEFNDLYAELSQIIDEKEELVEKHASDEQYRKDFASYLEEELSYLDLIGDLMKSLNDYHANHPSLSSQEIENEWADVHILVFAEHIKRQQRGLKRFKDKYSNIEYQNLYDQFQLRFDRIANQMVKARDRMNQIALDNVNNSHKEEKKEETALVKQDVFINEEEFNKMNLEEQISHLKFLMKLIQGINLQNSDLNDTNINTVEYYVDYEIAKIPAEYRAIYERYAALLENLNKQKVEENSQNDLFGQSVDDYIEQSDIFMDQSIKLQRKIYEEEASMKVLVEKAEERKQELLKTASANEIAVYFTTVTLYENSKVEILKEDLNSFMVLETTRAALLKEFSELLKQHGMNSDCLQNEEFMNEEEYEKEFEQISNHIRFIQSYTNPGLERDHEVQKDIQKLNALRNTKSFIHTKDLMYFFIELGYSKKESLHLAKISLHPSLLEQEKKVAEQEKEAVFTFLEKTFTQMFDDLKKEEVKTQRNATVKEHLKKIEMKAYEQLSPWLAALKLNFEEIKQVQGILKKVEKEKVDPSKFDPDAIEPPYRLGPDAAPQPHQEEELPKEVNKEIIKLEIFKNKCKSLLKHVHKNVSKACQRGKKKVNGFISKIKAKRQPKNKMEIYVNIKNKVAAVFVMTGFATMLGAGAANASTQEPVKMDKSITFETKSIDLDQYASEIGKQIAAMQVVEEEPIQEVVENKDLVDVEVNNENTLDFDSQFTLAGDDVNIYTNTQDAIYETNGKDPYFSADTLRDVTGLVYEYNGEYISLNENDPDVEAKKAALESNGAKPVAAISKIAGNDGIEGRYNVNDIQVEGRGGR